MIFMCFMNVLNVLNVYILGVNTSSLSLLIHKLVTFNAIYFRTFRVGTGTTYTLSIGNYEGDAGIQ